MSVLVIKLSTGWFDYSL